MSALLTFAYSIYTAHTNPNNSVWLTLIVCVIAMGAFIDERTQEHNRWTQY